MRTYYFLFPFLIFYAQLCFSQETGESMIDGQILVPNQTSPEGIHVFNKSNNYGSVATPGGRFELLVKAGDTLYFSGIQFEAVEVVVTKAVMSSGMLRVEIREGINQLPEVVVKEHDLSGDLLEDSKNIETLDFEIPVMPPDIGPITGVKTVTNTALNEMPGGANILGLLGAGLGMLFPKRIKEDPPERHSPHDQIRLRQRLRDLLGDAFFTETLDLRQEEIVNFLDFAIGRDFQSDMLEEKQRLDLFEFLFEQREEFGGM